ncbi:MAG: EFR1 family ferrodoxin [Clostridiales bacterium]|nr:EFR1 family ferrodoxin [Clostridiales bacterium]
MRLVQIYFSPTGGTKKVADIVGKVWDREKVEIDLSKPQEETAIEQEDVCIVAVPVFGGRVPSIVKDRLEKQNGHGAQAVLIAVYGNRAYEDALLELKDIVTKQGFVCGAAIAAVAEHSIMRQFAAGRPDEKDMEQLVSFGKQIQCRFSEGKKISSLRLPGNDPYKAYGVFPVVPKATEFCGKCGLCARLCPVEAIDKNHPMETDSNRCISCMRCVAVCPSNARKIDEALVEQLSKKMEKVCSARKENQLFLGI